MEVSYCQSQYRTSIHYGQTFFQIFEPKQFSGKHLLFFTNQQYYEEFANQYATFFKDTEIDWYIFSNQLYCNTVTNMIQGLKFLEKFDPLSSYIMIALGNEGVIQLTSFFHQFSVLPSEFFVISLSIQSFSTALLSEKELIQPPFAKCLIWENLPQKIFFFSQRLSETTATKMTDFISLLKLALINDSGFYDQLVARYPTKESLLKQSFSNYIEYIIQSYAKDAYSLAHYGRWFEEKFYQTENSHVLSAQMKRFLGFFFHFIWNCVTIKKPEFCIEVIQWIQNIGFPITLPYPLMISDYLDKLSDECATAGDLVQLNFIGGGYQLISPNQEQFVAVYQLYEQILKEVLQGDGK